MDQDTQTSTKLYNRRNDVKSWYYFPIVMPLNSDGHGPASDNEIAELTFEVWSQDLISHYSSIFLPSVINKAIEMNDQLGWDITFEELWSKISG